MRHIQTVSRSSGMCVIMAVNSSSSCVLLVSTGVSSAAAKNANERTDSGADSLKSLFSF